MKTLTIKNIARLFPIIAVAVATIPLVGCGGGGATAGMAPLPPVNNDPGKIAATPAPVATPTPTPAAPAMNPQDTQVALATEAQVNAFRAQNGLPALQHDNALAAIAAAYSKRMATEGFFAHTDPQGKTTFDRANAAGYSYAILGENLAKVKTPAGTEAVFTVQEWQASPSHKENMLFAGYTNLAIGAYKDADGNYYMTLLFSKPN